MRSRVLEEIDRAPIAEVGNREVGHRLESALDVERDEEARDLREKGGADEELFALAHVAEAPDPPLDVLVVVADPLGTRVALEHPSVLEPQGVEAFALRVLVEGVDAAHEVLGILQLIPNEFEQQSVAPLGEELVGDAPELDEAPIEGDDLAAPVDHEEPVGRGFEGRVQDRHRSLERGLRLAGQRFGSRFVQRSHAHSTRIAGDPSKR